jgi:S-DNA-T family DNA segregation ATPase FtsK/SpoIIIE
MGAMFCRAFDHHVKAPLTRSGLLFVFLALGALVVGLARLCVKFWRTALFLAAVGFLIGSSGRWAFVEPTALALIVLGVWRWLWPESFRSWLLPRARAWWRMWTCWAWRWPGLARRHRLEVQLRPRHGEDTPAVETSKLVKVQSTRCLDRLLVTIPAGLSRADFEHAAASMAHATKAIECRIRADRPGRVWVELLRKDPLLKPIPAMPIPATVDLRAVPLGLREDGTVWTVGVLGDHVLGVGATGSGKAALLQGMTCGLAPAIADGLVEPWGFDPKGGMELAVGRPLYARLFDGDAESMDDGLEECAAFVRERAAQLAGTTRCHEPSAAMPLRLIVIDELAAITSFCDRRTAARVEKALGLILTMGRAVGVSVVAFLQDPGKDVIAYRNLFPTRIALRLGEAIEVDMVLKEGARDRGALADQIPMSLPGVGYVREDGNPDPIRVRAAYCTDDDIRATAAAYAYGSRRAQLQTRGPVSLFKPTTGEATA